VNSVFYHHAANSSECLYVTGPKNKHIEADRNELHNSHGSHIMRYYESKSLHADTQLWNLLFEQSDNCCLKLRQKPGV